MHRRPIVPFCVHALAALGLAFALGACGSDSGQADRAGSGHAGPVVGGADSTSERFTIDNNCGEDVWVVETPPGSARAVQAQWDWFRDSARYKTVQATLPNGGVVAALLLPKGASQVFDIPDRGAPGGNFRFYMGCPDASGTDPGGPFDPRGCIIGSSVGDLAGINTLFEPTFGCAEGRSDCAFNPAGDPARYPRCASDPGASNCPALATGDNFDVSAVDGYTVPIKVEATTQAGGSCNRLITDASMLDLASCPREDATTLYSDVAAQQARIQGGISLLTQDASDPARPLLRACSAPYKWFQSDTLGSPPSPVRASGECNPADATFGAQCFYAGAGCDASDPALRCPNGSGPQQKVGPRGDGTLSIQNTRWVQQLYAMGYKGYTWQYGDGIGDQACSSSSTYKVTLCPAGGVPYRGGQLWTWSAQSGACGTDGATGTPDGTTTFGSLFACQTARMRFVCEPVPDDQFKTVAALWRADPAATLAGTGSAYAAIAGLGRLQPQQVTLDTRFGRLTVPELNHVYGGSGSVCPTP